MRRAHLGIRVVGGVNFRADSEPEDASGCSGPLWRIRPGPREYPMVAELMVVAQDDDQLTELGGQSTGSFAFWSSVTANVFSQLR